LIYEVVRSQGTSLGRLLWADQLALEDLVLQPIDRTIERSYSCNMFKTGVRSNVPVRSLLLFAVAILAPALARADDFSLAGDSGCTDPPIFSETFTFQANSSGGLCLAFGNHSTSGMPFTSLKFTTRIPDTNSDPMLCSGGQFFTNCDYIVDTVHDTLTVEFSGLDDRHTGIPVAPGCSLTIDCVLPNNFSINLNNPTVCPPTGGPCTQPTLNTAGGDWANGGVGSTITGTANAVPEPRSGVFLVTALGALVARLRIARNRRC
jgi:hypothetical protein